MPVKLYYLPLSPPARAALLTLKTLGIPHEVVHTNLMKAEHKTDEFLKLNPQHTVPVLVDEDGFALSDSHAINAYLVSKYAKDDKLYPKELKAKAIVDQRLFFECGVLFHAGKPIIKAYIYEKAITGMSQALANPFFDAYDTLERYLSLTQYIAADHVTIADFSALTTLANMGIFVPVDEERYPKLAAYIKRGNANIPSLEELNKKGVTDMKEILFKDFNFQIL